MDNLRGSGGRQNRNRWPLSLDTRDPEQVASFSIALGYPRDDVVNTLVTRCNLSRFEARRIVDETISAVNTQGGTA